MVKADRYLSQFRSNFVWYPEKEQGDIVSVRATLTELGPLEYREIVYEWSLRDFVIWMEEVWLADKFDDMFETDSN